MEGGFHARRPDRNPSRCCSGTGVRPGKPILVSAGSDGIARLWQLPVAEPRRIDSKGAARVFVVSHEGSRAASAGADKIVRVWTLAEDKLVNALPPLKVVQLLGKPVH